MRQVLLIAGILVVAAGLLLSSCEERRLGKSEVLAVLDTLEQRLDWLEYRRALEAWRYAVEADDDSLDFYEDLYRHILREERWVAPLSSGASLVSDDVDRRRLELLKAKVLLGRVDAEPSVSDLRDSLMALYLGFRPDHEGGPTVPARLESILNGDANRVRRESAYRALQQVGAVAADRVAALFRMREQEARRLGYNDFVSMAFRLGSLDQDECEEYVRILDSLSRPAYRDLLERARRELRVDQVEIWDLAYLGADVRRRIDSYFPADSLLPFALRSMAAVDFDLDRLPVFFEDADSSVTLGGAARAFVIRPPADLRVVSNGEGGLATMRRLMHELGRVVFAAFVSQERPVFRRFIAPEWTEAMGRVFATVCDDPDWLTKYAQVPPDLAQDYVRYRRDERTIQLRLSLLRVGFELAAYRDPSGDLNRLYWERFVELLDLPRHDDMFPWAASPDYVARPLRAKDRLVGEIVAAQTHDFIRRRHERFTDNPTARSFLVQNYFRFGSRYDWPELVERGTGTALTPSSAASF